MSIFSKSVNRLDLQADHTGTESLSADTSAEGIKDESEIGAESQGTETQENTSLQQTEQSGESQEQTESQEAAQTGDAPTQEERQETVSQTRQPNKMHALLVTMNNGAAVNRRTVELQQHLQELKLIEGFTQVAKEQRFTAPLVAAFKATPGFEQAVKNFPKTELFSVVPEHTTDSNSVAGMESLSAAEEQVGDVIATKTQEMADAFTQFLGGIGPVVDTLLDQVRKDRTALESSDLTDDVLAGLPVTTVSGFVLANQLVTLDSQIKALDVFAFEELQAHPDRIQEEVSGLESLIVETGSILGLKLTEYGLVTTDKATESLPTLSTFGDKDISKTNLEYQMAITEEMLDALKVVSDHKDEITASVQTAAKELPASLSGDDTTYGRVDHVTMLGSYTTLASEIITNVLNTASLVLATADAALDIDAGVAA